jgi:hypothetical protein
MWSCEASRRVRGARWGGVRQVGLMAHGGFAEWYAQFIAHFIAVYEV